MRVDRDVQRIIPYHLATERTSVAGNATVTLVIQVPGDADFEARYVNGSFTSVTATCIFRDGGTRLELMNRPSFVALVTGTGQQPYVLPAPAVFVRNSTIEVVFNELSGNTNIVQFVFCGFLVYPAPINRL